METVLKGAFKERRKYVETFMNLTAEETKLTEIFDDKGQLKDQRKVAAYFLVYQSPNDDQMVSEYRVVREVDGKPIRDHAERAEDFIRRLAKTKNLEGEAKRLREENLRYRLHYYRWDITLHPAWQLEEKASSEYDYELKGRDKLGEREVVILSYHKKSFQPADENGIIANFKNPRVGYRGRVWLDAGTFNICRWENEFIVRHAGTDKTLVVVRDEVSYVPSDLGISVPERIVTSFFDKLQDKSKVRGETRTYLRGRITYVYSSFKRFNVTSQEEIFPVEKN